MSDRTARLFALVGVLFSASVCLAQPASPPGAVLPAAIPLAGDGDKAEQWEFLPGHDADDVAGDLAKFAALPGWTTAPVPGTWPAGNLACGWYVKRFKARAEARGLDCEILFERVHWSATVWLNGRKIGGCPDGYAPFRLLASEAIKPGAENVLVVRVGGYGEVPKGANGKPLFPAGFATAGRGGGGGIMGRVFVRFFRKVRLTRVQVLPDLAKSTANVLVRVEGAAPQATVSLAVWDRPVVSDDDAFAGTAEATIKLTNGVGEATIPVLIKGCMPWTPAKPFLYHLAATASVNGQLAASWSDRFGMREFVGRPDGFYLNGRKIRLFGANIIGDMGYWRGAPNLFERAKIKAMLIDPAVALGAVCLRTHTAPIPKWWLDVCDEEGMLILLEFPVTVNCGRIDFAPAELAAFQKNLMDEASAVVPYLANHPSIIMWVMTNESNNWHEWERTKLYEHFKGLDPSRPAIRASYDTPDAIDIHSYAATWKGSYGDFDFRCWLEAQRAARAKVPLMISEFLDGMDLRVTRKWFGPLADNTDPAVRQRLAELTPIFHASRAMEQDEAARRLGYACILPFGPGCFGAGTPKPPPTFYAVRNTFAPVGLSLNLADRHFVAGAKHPAEVWIMNDTDEDQAVIFGLTLTSADPGFDPDAPLVKPVVQGEPLSVVVKPHSTVKHTFQWTAPAEEGPCFLQARLTRAESKPVISRRTVFAVKREPPPASLAGRKLLVIEEGAKLSAWAGKLGCTLVDRAGVGKPPAGPGQPSAALAEAQLVILGRRATSQPEFAPLIGQLPGYVQRGGRVVVLEQFDWPKLKDLFGIAIERTDYDYDDDNAPADQVGSSVVPTAPRVSQSQASGGSSRVFRWEQPERTIWRGLPDECLFHWNGQHGRVARVSMSTLPGRARVLVKYAEAERDDLRYVPVAAVAHGAGEVLYFMLQTAGRYDPSDPDFDPVVERVMMNLLGY